MIRGWQVATSALAIVVMVATLGAEANAAQCGNGPGGFEAWKQQFSGEASAKGIGATAIAALMQTHYASATIAADRGQRSFGLSLEQFMAKRGSATIVARGPIAEAVAGGAVRLDPAALWRAAGTVDRDLGHGERLWQPARQPEHAVLDRNACL
ncbi:hypothetical protein ABIF26_006520 [Bradyrhizobium elkanii]